MPSMDRKKVSILKILYLCHRIPYPPNKGDKIRSFNEVRYLAARHEVDLLCLADEPEDLKYQADLEKICKRVAVYSLDKTHAKVRGVFSLVRGGSISVGYFYQRRVQDCCNRWLKERRYDAIVCFSSTMAEYVFRAQMPAARPRLIMDFCDVDSDKWIQYASESRWPMNWVYRLENRRLADYESRIYRDFDHSVVISEAEAALFRQVCPEARDLAVIANGVDSEYFDSSWCDDSVSQSLAQTNQGKASCPPTIVFTGAMDYHANVDGVCWFSREIWPTLKKMIPDLQFTIVGSKPAPAVCDLAVMDGITVTGFVEDVRPYYQSADLCVIPLRMARGVQNKVLEAMAMGKAVVTTSKANAGIMAKNREHLRVAETPEQFIEVIKELLNEQEKRVCLGLAARAFVVDNYNWAVNMDKLERLLI